MKPLDNNYLSLQFKNKILTKDGTEFQTFFEDIMQKAFPDFEKIQPYGKEGDGGNDGYIKKLGAYYQVYAPNTPSIKEAEAAKKLLRDFEKLKNKWDHIAEITKYYFVYNDKNDGSTIKLEEAITQLEKSNPEIEFEILSPKKLEIIFFRLNQTDILNLGFNIDSRQAILNAYEYLNKVEVALDRENGIFAYRTHNQIENIIKSLQDEQLAYEYELLKGRCLQKLEKIPEAKECYQNLSKRYLNDPRPILYLAELHLLEKNYDQNKLIIEQVDQTHWLQKLEALIRKSSLGEAIDISLIDENLFPEDSRIRSNFYRLYAGFFERSGDFKRSDNFIEKAIYLNPDRFNNYEVKLSFIEARLFSSIDKIENFQTQLNEFAREIEKVEKKFLELGDIRDRSKASLLFMKLNVFRIRANYKPYEELVKIIFDLTLNCYFDKNTERILVGILWGIFLSKANFNNLLHYLKQTEIEISEELSQTLIIQFNLHNSLFAEGKKFFNDKKNQKYVTFIEDIENNKYEKVITFLTDFIPFAIGFADSLVGFPELRNLIIENLPDDSYKSKEMLLLMLYYDEKDYDKAFDILKKIDLSKLNYLECRPLLQIVQEKKAWDLEVRLIKKLLEYERDPKIILNLKLKLFSANFNLENYLGAVDVGKELLAEHANQNQLDLKNKESLLAQTIQSYLRRGEDDKAYELLNTYKFLANTPEFKLSIETDVFLKNNLPNDALDSIVSGVKIKKRLSPEEYASLFYILVQIENLIGFNLQSLDKVESNCFVKLVNQDRWYFVGEGEELDATKIDKQHDHYFLLIEKHVGEEILFSDKYSSKKNVEIIESILTIDKYILWQCRLSFEELSRERRWEGAKMIEVPEKDDSIDTQYLLTFLQDEQKKRDPLFQLYCNQNIPLALLALNEGGLTHAIARIVQERKGFIKCSTGIISEMENQKRVATEVINKNLPFYIDGTSALVLSEIGFLEKIHTHISYIKIPQSVITMLLEVANRFRLVPGEGGTLGFARGQIIYSAIDKEKSKLIQNNFISSIKILESKLGSIISISSANKMDCLAESKMLAELCDACILAQKENVPILTEDYLYLQMNELETKKKAPEYFSSISLIRVLYEQGKMNYDDYLEYFGYLSSYRFRFLSLNPDDIQKAVFGDRSITKIQPSNIRKLNFPLTLSEEYGVPSKSAFNVLLTFLLKIIVDDSITISIVETIYAEILSTLPVDKSKKEFGRILLKICIEILNQQYKNIVLGPTIQEKINKLSELTEIYNYENKIWLP